MIRVDRLTKKYKKKTAVHELSFEAKKGTVFALLGANGAGKSTTIKCILGIAGKHEGNITVGESSHLDGKDQHACKPHIGYSPETPYFPPYLTGLEVLTYYGKLQGLHGTTLRDESMELLNIVGLNDTKEAVRHYSKGMLQRLALAQALLGNPDILILDEPCAGLDAAGRIEMVELIRALKQQGKTILMNSHVLSDIEKVCDDGIIMQSGKLVRQFTADDLAGSKTLEELFIETIRKKEL